MGWATILQIRSSGELCSLLGGSCNPAAAANLPLCLLSCASTAEFSIWTREAGAGGLSIAVEGPSKAEITFDDHKDGSCGASYIVQEPGMYWGQITWKQHWLWLWKKLRTLTTSLLSAGNYEVSIKFNDEHIPESPYLVPVIAPSDDARRLTVTSLQVRHKETSLQLTTETDFVLVLQNRNGCPLFCLLSK